MNKKRNFKSDSKPQGNEFNNRNLIGFEILQNLPVAVYRTTPEGKIIQANKAFAEMLGYDSIEDLLRMNVKSLFLPEERRAETLVELEKPETYYVEYQMKRKNAGPVWLRDYPYLVKDNEGKTIFYDGVILNISDRKAAEEKIERKQEELEEKIKSRTDELLQMNDMLLSEVQTRRRIAEALKMNEAKFEGIARRSFDVILEVNEKGEIVYVSASIERMSGYKSEDIIGKPFKYLLAHPEDSKVNQGFRILRKKRNLKGIQVELLKEDGSIAFVEMNASPFVVKGKTVGSNINIRDITERKRAEHSLLRRIDELTVLYDVSKICVESGDADDLIERVTHIIGETLYPTSFGFMLCDRENNKLLRHPSYRIWDGSEQLEIEIGKGITGTVAKTGEPQLIGDVRDCDLYFSMDTKTKSELCVPLKLGDRILGVINTESDRYNAFSKYDERLLMTFAGQITPALERIRMDKSLHYQLKELKVLHNVANACIEAKTPRELMDRVVKIVVETLYTTNFGILLVDEKKKVLSTEASYYYFDGPKEFSLELGRGITGKVAITGQPIRENDVKKSLQYLKVDTHTQSELCIPLKVGNKIIGVLNAESEHIAAFTEDDERLLMIIASQIALSLDALYKEIELRNEKDQVKNYLDIAGAILVAMDDEFNIKLINRRGCSSLGLDSRDLIGKNWIETCVPERMMKGERALLSELLSRTEITYFPSEGKIKTSSGAEKIISWNRNVLRDSTGKAVGILCSGEDITVRTELRERLKKSEEEYRTLVENINIGVFRSKPDQNGTILKANSAMANFFGFSSSENLIGRMIADFGIDAKTRKYIQRQIKKNGFVKDIEFPLKKKNDEQAWYALSSSAQFDENGKLIWIDNVLEDITDMKRSRDALLEEKERLAVTLRSIGDAVITVDAEGYIILINRVALQLMGLEEEEVVGKRLPDFLILENIENSRDVPCNIDMILKEGRSFNLDKNYSLISRSGNITIVSCGSAPIKDADNKTIGAVLVLHDVTERTKLEDELRKAQKLESIGLLAGGIAHDFNNILAAILGNMSLAKLQSDINSKTMNYLERAESAINRATYLTNQLLTFSKGGAPIKKVVSIKDLLSETVKFTLTGSGVEAKFDIQKGLWNTVIDKEQINQVIGNIVLNAVQAMTDSGTIKIKAENIFIESRKNIDSISEGEWVCISITDTGSGITKENLTKIFDPYFTTKKNGTGLGLAISYSIIKKHQGLLKAESELGKGSTFYIYLPAYKGEAEVEPDRSLKLVRGKGRILYMDDEKTLCETVKDILIDLGYSVTTAYDGTKAVDLYKKAQEQNLKYDLVILDLTVPGSMGGKETLGMIKKLDPVVKALATSGYSNDPIMANFRSFGFIGTIPKPFRIHELAEIIKKNL